MKSLLRDLPKLMLACFIVTSIFLVYYKFIGIPKTEARTLYNQAQIALGNNDKETAKQDLQKAVEFWKEPYIQDALEKLQ